jgi:hypothetical protein
MASSDSEMVSPFGSYSESRWVGGTGGVGWSKVCAEGVDVFVLGQVDGLEQDLRQVGQGGGGFGFDLALGYGGEEVAQGGA